MQTKLSWKKNLLSNLYNIYSNDQHVGTLKEKTFSQTTNAELNGKKYIFQTRGFIKQYTEIIDPLENKVIGKITYNNWATKATISINYQLILWKYDNLWSTRWSIYNADGINIKYAGSSSKGQIDSNTDDALLLLTGLFVTNFYWQMSLAVVFIALIPIWTAVLN